MKDFKNNTYLLLGTNQGNRLDYLHKAKAEIINQVGNITQSSSIYETAAWGVTDQPNFLNQVVLCSTILNPEDLLEICQKIEKQLGRKRIFRWGQRTMDIDILYFNNEIISSKELEIPHTQIQNRRFTLVPLVEIAEKVIHPVLKKTQLQLLKECKDELVVKNFVVE